MDRKKNLSPQVVVLILSIAATVVTHDGPVTRKEAVRVALDVAQLVAEVRRK